MQPINNNITSINSVASTEDNSPATDNSPLVATPNMEQLNLPINTRQIVNTNRIEYTPSKFMELLASNKLPKKPIYVEGYIVIDNNTEITQLPENLTITGELQLNACPNIKSIPTGLRSNKLVIKSCEKLEEFAKNIEIDSLEVGSCNSLYTFGDTIVNTNILLANCDSITSLPKLSNSIQNISIFIAHKLRLPDNLQIKGALHLFACTDSDVLGENMEIGGDFIIDSAINLTKLPDKLRVGGDISISCCPNLRSLPDFWLEDIPNNLPVTPENHHVLSISRTAILDGEIRHYNSITPEYIGVIGYQVIKVTSEYTVEDLIKSWQAFCNNKDIIEITDITATERSDLRQFLHKASETASAINENTKQYFANQIINILKLIANNKEIKQQALLIINNHVSDCADRISLAVAELDFLPLLFEAEKQAKTDKQGLALLSVAKQALYMEEIKKYAMMHAEKNEAIAEEVEFILSYLIKLSSYFSLSLTVKDMNHDGIPDITDADINKAYEAINTKVTDEYFNKWLQDWDPWQKHTRLWSLKQYAVLTRKKIAKKDIDKNAYCVISLNKLHEMQDPVYYKEQLYSYEYLCKWYIEKATNPLNSSEIINIADIHLLQIDETDENNEPAVKKRKLT